MRVDFLMNTQNVGHKEYITNQLPYYSPYLYNPSRTNQYNSKKKKYIMGQNEWTSLFIPVIDSSYTKECLKSIIEDKYMIGLIFRIDLVKLKENTYCHTDDYSAFIHFHHWYYNAFTVRLREYLETHKSFHMKYYYDTTINMPRDFFVLMKNKSTVMSSTENINIVKPISQVRKRTSSSSSSSAENNLNHTLLKQQKRIELLEDELDVLKKLIRPEGI